MKTLYIETSTEKSFLAIGDLEILAITPLTGGPNLSKNLALEVHKLLSANDFRPERIAIGKGPGSYTGVRVGAALGKALAFGWKIPLVEFCSLKTFFPPEETKPFAVLVDARMGGIYVLSSQMKAPELLSEEAAQKALKEIPLLFSPTPLLIEKRLGRPCLEACPHFSPFSGSFAKTDLI